MKLIVKKDYAKKKAMYLNKCFQNNEVPVPGPLVQSNDGKFLAPVKCFCFVFLIKMITEEGTNEENYNYQNPSQQYMPQQPQQHYIPTVPQQPQQHYMPSIPQPSPRREPEVKPSGK